MYFVFAIQQPLQASTRSLTSWCGLFALRTQGLLSFVPLQLEQDAESLQAGRVAASGPRRQRQGTFHSLGLISSRSLKTFATPEYIEKDPSFLTSSISKLADLAKLCAFCEEYAGNFTALHLTAGLVRVAQLLHSSRGSVSKDLHKADRLVATLLKQLPQAYNELGIREICNCCWALARMQDHFPEQCQQEAAKLLQAVNNSSTLDWRTATAVDLSQLAWAVASLAPSQRPSGHHHTSPQAHTPAPPSISSEPHHALLATIAGLACVSMQRVIAAHRPRQTGGPALQYTSSSAGGGGGGGDDMVPWSHAVLVNPREELQGWGVTQVMNLSWAYAHARCQHRGVMEAVAELLVTHVTLEPSKGSLRRAARAERATTLQSGGGGGNEVAVSSINLASLAGKPAYSGGGLEQPWMAGQQLEMSQQQAAARSGEQEQHGSSPTYVYGAMVRCLSSRDIAQISWVYASLKFRHGRLFDALEARSQALMVSAPRSFTPQELSLLAWAFAACGAGTSKWFELLAGVAEHNLRYGVGRWRERHLVRLAEGFGAARQRHQGLLEALAAHLMEHSLDSISPWHLATLLNVFATLEFCHPGLIATFADLAAAKLDRRIGDWTPEVVTALAAACGRLGVTNHPPLVVALATSLSQQLPRRLTVSGAADIACALVTLCPPPAPPLPAVSNLLDRLAVQVKAGQAWQLQPHMKHTTRLSGAYARRAHHHPDIIEVLAEACDQILALAVGSRAGRPPTSLMVSDACQVAADLAHVIGGAAQSSTPPEAALTHLRSLVTTATSHISRKPLPNNTPSYHISAEPRIPPHHQLLHLSPPSLINLAWVVAVLWPDDGDTLAALVAALGPHVDPRHGQLSPDESSRLVEVLALSQGSWEGLEGGPPGGAAKPGAGAASTAARAGPSAGPRACEGRPGAGDGAAGEDSLLVEDVYLAAAELDLDPEMLGGQGRSGGFERHVRADLQVHVDGRPLPLLLLQPHHYCANPPYTHQLTGRALLGLTLMRRVEAGQSGAPVAVLPASQWLSLGHDLARKRDCVRQLLARCAG